MFWITPATLKEMYGKDFQSVKLFSLTHIIELLLVVIACIIIATIFKKVDKKKRQQILVIISILMLIDEVIKHIATALTGQWIWQYLPLHLCSINIFVCVINTFKPNKLLKEITYGLCLPGAILALLISTWFTAPVLNIMHLHSYTIHGLLVIYSVLILTDGHKPNYKTIPKMLLALIIVLIPIYFINIKLSTNFFFLNDPNDNVATKLLASIFGEKLFFLGMPIILVVLWLLMYLPFLPKTRHKF